MGGKFSWKTFMICFLLILSITTSVMSPILYFVIGNKQDEQTSTAPSWFDGEGVPDNSVGIDGDYYLDTQNGVVYQKKNSVWEAIYEIGKGEDGEPGPAGKDGNAVRTGSGNPNTSQVSGKTGDLYLDTVTGDLYEKQENGNWLYKTNFKGIQGDKGENGASWEVGDKDPRQPDSGVQGENGDFYLNTETWDLYKKTDNVWGIVGNIKGDNGQTGSAGQNGATWKVGKKNPQGVESGNVGDLYLNTDDWNVYECKGEKTWDLVGNIQGDIGLTGKDGKDGTIWKFGQGSPEGVIQDAKEGDYYLDQKDYIIYRYEQSSWKSVGSIKGKDGDNGLPGSNGDDGIDGTIWQVGTKDPMQGQVTGKVGDLYLNTNNWTIYQCTEAETTWEEVGIIQGKEGDRGPDGAKGDDGSSWKFGNGNPTSNDIQGKEGDFYLDKDNLDVWHYESDEWQYVGNIKGKTGQDGASWQVGTKDPTLTESNVQGKDGDFYLNSETFILYTYSDGEWQSLGSIKGKEGEQGNQGQDGEPGQDGKDAVDMYMGYDGYIWYGTERSDWYIPETTVDENVFEHTTEVAEVMSKYFDSGYVDLSSSYIALMPYYKKNINATLYSGMEAVEITVFAETAGKLYIGSTRVDRIEEARTNGSPITMFNKQELQVQEGKNVIKLPNPLNINEDETIVLGGNGSVSLYYAKDIPANDEPGNFTVIDGQPHSELLEKNGKTYNDTLAIQVKMELTTEKPIFEGLRKQIQENVGNLSVMKDNVGDEYWGAYIYDYESPNQNLFSGKTITKIGVPVKGLVKKSADGDSPQPDGGVLPYLDLYKINAYSSKNPKDGDVMAERQGATFLSEHRLNPPLRVNSDEEFEEYQRELEEANDEGCAWIDFDCHIELGEDETLAFCGSAHGVEWLYLRTDVETSSNVINDADFYKYKYIGQVGKTEYEGTKDATTYMFFDVYYEVTWSLAEQLQRLDQLEYEASEVDRLREKVAGKYISILGDSISTYEGYSNEYETQNKDIKNNGGEWTNAQYNAGVSDHNKYGNLVAYPYNGLTQDKTDITDAEDTWWLRTIQQVNMNLCVNNSYSGDFVRVEANRSSMRCQQLHDNTTNKDSDANISSQNQAQNEEIYPDIVAFYMGINDFNYSDDLTPENFEEAYKKIVNTIFTTYQPHKSDLKVFVFTLLPNTWGQAKLSKVGDGGITEEEYISNLEKLNEKIRQVARDNPNVEVVDLYRSLNFTRASIIPYTGDNLHPNAAGMRLISNCFIKALYDKFVGK